ncbi:MAG: hypothetical protein H6579_04795 [Chitinophagales bacterium]|nr:hypothetical protein [Bacteroidota bacterium]MCB9256426.1 hypothetical protein [Chitinophagales bacterium]
MEEEISRQEIVKKLSEFALEQRQEGKSDEEIQALLAEKHVDAETISIVMRTVNFVEQQQVAAEDEGSGIKGWIVWIALLVGINVLSAIFDWGFWVY